MRRWQLSFVYLSEQCCMSPQFVKLPDLLLVDCKFYIEQDKCDCVYMFSCNMLAYFDCVHSLLSKAVYILCDRFVCH